jgi:hypothetical protein
MPDFNAYVHPESEITYHGSCHCGKTRFTVTMPPLDTVTASACNCSICTVNGYLNVHPLRKNVVFASPYDELGSYVFGSKSNVHKFCKTCGTSLLIDLENSVYEPLREHYAVNVRPLGWYKGK